MGHRRNQEELLNIWSIQKYITIKLVIYCRSSTGKCIAIEKCF